MPTVPFPAACGGSLTASGSGGTNVTYPLLSDKYPANMTCVWEVMAPWGWKMDLHFTKFDLEKESVSYLAAAFLL